MNGVGTHREKRELQKVVSLRVEVLRGPDAGRHLESSEDTPISIGTDESNALVLTDPKVSRFHLEIVRDRGGARVDDLGSSNGTWLAGAAIERARVFAGAELAIGDSVLVVRDGAARERDDFDDAPAIPGFVAASAKSRRVARQIAIAAPSQASVLLLAETGSGKEVAARALHALSPRREGPFVVVDCGSLPATLIASELFGHERGAFTGADRRRSGAFELARGGTIFLDEIGELPLAVQPALLAPLERRRFRRVGGEQEIDVDVRVIAATHRDLRASVNDGSFRADLYYRLAVARIELPALRERPEEIPALVRHFVREITGREGLGPFDAAAMSALQQHRWSGNVRELRNVVEAALAMGEVRLEREGEGRSTSTSSYPPGTAVDAPAIYSDARAAAMHAFERSYLESLVSRCGSNASEASRVAHMDRNHLVSLLRKHGLR